MSRPMLPLDVNKVDSVGQQEAMIGIEDDDVKERQTEPNLKMTTEANLCAKDSKKTENNRDSDADNVMAREDIPPHQKRRKTRRGRAKRRRTKPYSKTVWEEKKLERERRRRSVNEALTEVFIHGQPVAPYNTTQFLIDDHNSFPDLDVQLQAVGNTERPASETLGVAEDGQQPRPARPTNRPSRTRDSSFSIDSDDDYFYSSPEDEGEFLTKEFSNTYEVVHAERLGTLSKSQLIQDYVQLEEKVDMLEKKLQKKNSSSEGKGTKPTNSEETSLQDGSSDDTEQDGSVSNARLNEPVNLSQEEITKIIMENERLTRENERLRLMCSQMGLGADAESVSSSVDSESDSSSSTYSSVGEESADSSDRTNTPPIPTEIKTSPVENKTSPLPVDSNRPTSPLDSKTLPLDA